MRADLPPGWIWTTLGEIAEWGSGGTPRRTDESYYGGDIPWAVIGDLNDETVTECKGSITREGLSNSSCKIVCPGTILIAMYGSIGKLGIAGVPMATNQAIASAVARINSQYLFYFLLAQRSQLAEAGKGATQRNISQTILKAWPIPVAPPMEQDRIVVAIEEHLSRLEAIEAGLASAAQRTARLLESVFDDQLRSTDMSRLPLSHFLTERLANGRSVPTAANDGHPVLRLTAIKDGSIDPSAAKLGDFGDTDPNRYAIAPGDFLISRGNGSLQLVGRGGLVQAEAPQVAYPDTMIRARVDESRLNPKFLSLVWNGRDVRRQLESQARTTAGIYKVNQSMIGRVELPAPSLDAQHRLVQAAAEARQTVVVCADSLNRSRVSATALQRSILSRAFNGRLISGDSILHSHRRQSDHATGADHSPPVSDPRH